MQRGGEQSLTAVLAQALDAPRDELFDVARYRKGFVGRKHTRPLLQYPPDLEGEEGVPPARGVHSPQCRPGKRQPEVRPEQAVGRAEAERPRPDALEAFAQGPVEPERQTVCLVCPLRHEQCHWIVAEPAGDEREHVRRRTVQPLHIVDRDEEFALAGKRSQRSEHGDGNHALVGRAPACILEQQGHLESMFLRRWKP